MKNHLILLLCCAATLSCFAQSQPIYFTNPSFEDLFANASTPPRNWHDCGFRGESPPDINPNLTFNVTKPAYDGETYLGMVVRDNNTWESVSQRVSNPFQKGACYQFEVYLARSLTYMSISRVSDKPANYATPAKLRVWAGNGPCDKQQLLGETKLVINTNWKPYIFQFGTEEIFNYIILEAYYDNPDMPPYCGNILLDKLSDIKQVDCAFSADVAPDQEIVEQETEAPHPPAKPISETELAAIVETYANRITFDDFGSLRRMLYTNPNTGKEKWVNLPLHTILEGLQQHPLTNLILVIVEKDPDLSEKKKQSLKTALRNMGARNDQVIVRGWQENDAAKSWSGDPDSGVLLRLIR